MNSHDFFLILREFFSKCLRAENSNGRPTLRLKREASPDRKCRDEERRGKKYAAGDGAPGNDSRGHGKSGPPHHQTCLPSS